MHKAPLLVIAAGGTGGHMFPAQALAEHMLAKGWRIKLFTDARGARYATAFPSDIERVVLPAATFARGGLVAKLIAPFAIFMGVLLALVRMGFDRPSAVAGFGGYPALPAMAASVILRVRRVIHEQNGVLGRVNRFFAPYVDVVACSVAQTNLPRGARGVHTRNPEREAILKRHAAPYEFDAVGPLEVLVIGGSQGARALSQSVPQAIALLPDDLKQRLRIMQQARSEDEAEVRAAYEHMGVAAEIAPFFPDVPERLVRSQLVISRSGASSVADIATVGRPSILIPYPAAAQDHQTANALGLLEAVAARLCPEADLTPEALSREIAGILTRPSTARAMAEAALSVARPNATSALAALLMKETDG